MIRALDVATGCTLILSLWLWAMKTLNPAVDSWWDVVGIIAHLSVACFLTAPVYREYLK